MLILLLFCVDLENFLTDLFLVIAVKTGFGNKSLHNVLLVGFLLFTFPESHDRLWIGDLF